MATPAVSAASVEDMIVNWVDTWADRTGNSMFHASTVYNHLYERNAPMALDDMMAVLYRMCESGGWGYFRAKR